MKKILGLGNALTDVLIPIKNEQILKDLHLPKGGMTLIDINTYRSIMAQCSDMIREYCAGGSAANTINGIANLGMPCGFIGKVGEDKFGELFLQDLTKNRITPVLSKSKTPSGLAITFITPDSERTFGTYLGAAVELSAEDISSKNFEGYDYCHIEGFMVQNHELMRKAFALAKENGVKISLDLASFGVVEENLEFLKEVMTTYVDVVFANEEESNAFTGKEPETSLHELATLCDVAIVKIGAKGSMIKANNQFWKEGVINAKSKDTTGAGDLYASGVLYGLANDFSLEKCARYGSILSGNVIEVFGAKMDKARWEMIHALLKQL